MMILMETENHKYENSITTNNNSDNSNKNL